MANRMICAAAAFAAIALFASGTNARAQAAHCIPCVDERWDSLGEKLELRAANLKSAREYLLAIEQVGSPEEIAEARRLFQEASAAWNEIYATAEVLGARSYDDYLVNNLARIETSRGEALAELQRKREQLDRLRNAIGDQRARISADLAGEEREALRIIGVVAFEAALNRVKLAGFRAQTALRAMTQADRVAKADEVRRLNGVLEWTTGVDVAKANADLANGDDIKAAIGFLQMPVEAIAWKWSARLVPGAILVGPLASLTLDLALLGQNQIEQDQARDRLKGLDNFEFQREVEIRALTARVENLTLDGEVASHAIERRDAFEEQFSAIQGEMPPGVLAP